MTLAEMVYSCRSLIVTVNHYEALLVGIGQGMAELVFCYRINCIFLVLPLHFGHSFSIPALTVLAFLVFLHFSRHVHI